MFKKAIILFVCLILISVIAGCKGARTVKVLVDHPNLWYVQIYVDSDLTTRTGYATETYDLGDKLAKITVKAYRTTTDTNNLTVKIMENYDNGFLYTESSTVKNQLVNSINIAPYPDTVPLNEATASVFMNANPYAIATVTYDFSVKN